MMGLPMGMNGMMTIDPELAERMRAQAIERVEKKTAEDQEPAPDAEFKFEENGVTEEMIVQYITSRAETLDKARLKIRLQHAKIKNLESKLELAEKKGDTLRDAIAKLREELKATKAELEALKAGTEGNPADEAVPAEAPVENAPAPAEA